MTERSPAMAALDVFVGEWVIEARSDDVPPDDIGARMVFEWVPGQTFLVQRWSVPIPEAPDGIAIIGEDTSGDGGYIQHYFDSRGVARLYRMTLNDNVWTLWRDKADFSPLHFSQRYTANDQRRRSDDDRHLGDLPRRHDAGTGLRPFLSQAVLTAPSFGYRSWRGTTVGRLLQRTETTEREVQMTRVRWFTGAMALTATSDDRPGGRPSRKRVTIDAIPHGAHHQRVLTPGRLTERRRARPARCPPRAWARSTRTSTTQQARSSKAIRRGGPAQSGLPFPWPHRPVGD